MVDRSECRSFVSTVQSEGIVVQYDWDGETIGLELMRRKHKNDQANVVYWGQSNPLGVTFGVEEASRRIIVTRTTRHDVSVGDLVFTARGVTLTEDNLGEQMVALKIAHSQLQPGQQIPFVFAPAPPPVFVKSCAGKLNRAGVDSSFELRYVDQKHVRYLTLGQLDELIHLAPKPCPMLFVQHREEFLRQQQLQQAQAMAAAAAVTAAASVCAVTLF